MTTDILERQTEPSQGLTVQFNEEDSMPDVKETLSLIQQHKVGLANLTTTNRADFEAVLAAKRDLENHMNGTAPAINIQQRIATIMRVIEKSKKHVHIPSLSVPQTIEEAYVYLNILLGTPPTQKILAYLAQNDPETFIEFKDIQRRIEYLFQSIDLEERLEKEDQQRIQEMHTILSGIEIPTDSESVVA